MNALLSLGRTGTYLNTEWRGSGTPWASKPPEGAFVTISRQSGSGGAMLSRLLARELNGEASPGCCWNIFEGNLTTRMLKANHLPARIARFLPEDRISEINASVGELVGLHPCLWDLVQKTNQTLRELATAGQAILVGRGANFATAGIRRGVHVRLVAPAAYRAKYMAQLYDISESAALDYNAKRDAARRRYVQSVFSSDVNDPTAYDLVLNMAQMTMPEAVRLICAQVEARTPKA